MKVKKLESESDNGGGRLLPMFEVSCPQVRMKRIEPKPKNIHAAEPVEQQLKCPNHDGAFSQCI